MRRVVLRAGAAFALGLGLVSLPVFAEDTKPASEPPPTSETATKPTFPGYIYVTDVVGEVVKADDKSITLRITWFAPQNGKTTRPNLHQNNRNFHNPYAPNQNRPHGQIKEHHHDYTLDYLPQSLVRVKTLPAKLDENGKKVPHTQKELDELRAPAGVTGYAANRSDVTAGTIVEVILIRDKTVTAEKATDADLRIKHAIIQGHDANPPKDIANAGNKKDNKKEKK